MRTWLLVFGISCRQRLAPRFQQFRHVIVMGSMFPAFGGFHQVHAVIVAPSRIVDHA